MRGRCLLVGGILLGAFMITATRILGARQVVAEALPR